MTFLSRFLQFAAVLCGMTSLAYAQSTAPCTVWTSTSNTNYAGGTLNSAATTLAACQAACTAQSSCVAIDWNPTGSLNSACYILTSLSGTRFSTTGITHYDLNRACLAASTVPQSGVITTISASCYSWTQENNTNYAGGTVNAADTIAACQSACIATPSCIAIDFNTLQSSGQRCFLLSSLSGQKFLTAGIIHYNLTRTTCNGGGGGSNTNPATYRPTRQITTLSDSYDSDYAVDGNSSTKSCTTTSSPQPWWSVTLDQPSFVINVQVTNVVVTANDSSGVSALGLNRFIVGLSNTLPIEGQELTVDFDYIVCAWRNGTVTAGATVTLTCSSNSQSLPYKYVIIQSNLSAAGALCIAEVQVTIKTDVVYSIIYRRNYGVAFVNPSNGQLQFSSRIDDADLFVVGKCLAAVRSGFNSSQNCISMYAIDYPAAYARSGPHGNVIMETDYNYRDDGLSYSRYVEDTSFFALPNTFYQGYTALQHILFAGSDFYYSSRGFFLPFNATSPPFRNPASLSFSSLTLPSTPNADQCPNVWTRINNAKSRTSFLISSSLSSDECRQWCLVQLDCTGVYYDFDAGDCYLDSASNETSFYPVASKSAYFDLTKTFYSRCTIGCAVEWEYETKSLTTYRVATSTTDFFTCTYDCYYSTTFCYGITFDGPVSKGSCSTYLRSGTNNGNVNLWVSNRTFDGCGPCNSFAMILADTSVSNAVYQPDIGSRTACLTACANHRLCQGFNFDDNGNCYLGLDDQAVLGDEADVRYFHIGRSPCGNGCQDKWDFYSSTRLLNGTLKSDFTNEQRCRLSCQAENGCRQASWDIKNKRCYFGDGSFDISFTGSAPGWNYYRFRSADYCDDDG